MSKVVLTFGLIAGAIVAALMWLSQPLMGNGTISFENGMLVGYATMIIALSLVFVGVKSYRDNYNNGTLTFGKGFQVGILIAIVASFVYAVSWEAYLTTLDGDFMEQYSTQYIKQMERDGATASEIEEMRVEMTSMSDMYKNPLIRFGMTLMEIVPVGLVIALLSAVILKRGQKSVVA